MAWTTLTTDELLQEFNAREQAALDAIKGDASLAGILDRAVAECRGAIAAGGYTLGDEGTLPDGLKSHCIALARWRFLTSVGKNEALQTQERKLAHDRAVAILDKINAQDYAVEPPTATSTRAGNWNAENKLVMRMHPVPRPGTQYQGTSGAYANDDAPADAT